MKPELIVHIDAYFKWANPPADKAEEIWRNQANTIARASAHKLRQAVQLITLEMLEAQYPGEKK